MVPMKKIHYISKLNIFCVLLMNAIIRFIMKVTQHFQKCQLDHFRWSRELNVFDKTNPV